MGNVTVEAPSKEEAIRAMEDTINGVGDGAGVIDSFDIVGSLYVDKLGVEEL